MEEYNPWWRGELDPIYGEWLEYKVKWIPTVIKEFTLRPFALHFLIGPRQVGKTTALKILIYDILKKRDPRSVFYYSCDELADYRELGSLLDNYVSARGKWGVKGSVIILDEITFVEDWFRALKSRIDRGVFKRDVIIVAGSASLELLAGKERFPGRRGFGKDVYMLPLSFREYVLHFSKVRPLSASLLNEDNFWKKVQSNKLYSRTLSDLFVAYLETGGFPLPIREYFERGKVTYFSYKAYLDWLRTDWLKASKAESYMKEVIAYILETSSTPLSWYSISRNTSISSPHTARNYVETLENLLVAKVLHWISPSGEVNYRKEKKVIFTDPFIYKVLSMYTHVEVNQAAIVEAVVASHLARKFSIYYWRDRTEIDVVALIDNKLVGFEVKWTRKPTARQRPIRVHILDKETIPLLLATLI